MCIGSSSNGIVPAVSKYCNKIKNKNMIYKKIQELIRRVITYPSQEKRTFPITDHKKEDKTTVKGD
jgi:hypothetical protein